jgi:TRAP-type uncharacterized transport system substrate-binding protein
MSFADQILSSDFEGNKVAVYHPAGGTSVSARVIFFNPGGSAPMDGGIMPTSMILAEGSIQVFQNAAHNDTLVIDGITYYIIGVTIDNMLDAVLLDLSLQAVE